MAIYMNTETEKAEMELKKEILQMLKDKQARLEIIMRVLVVEISGIEEDMRMLQKKLNHPTQTLGGGSGGGSNG